MSLALCQDREPTVLSSSVHPLPLPGSHASRPHPPQVLLSQLEQWLHSAATLPNHFLPTSHLVSVDCSKVKQSIHAALERALSSLIARMHCSAQTQCRELSSKVDHYCKVRGSVRACVCERERAQLQYLLPLVVRQLNTPFNVHCSWEGRRLSLIE